MKKPYTILRSFYKEDVLDSIFSTIESNCHKKGMFSLNRGKVFPALLRRIDNSEKLLEVDRLIDAISQSVGYRVRATKHSEFQINTVGGWHTDLGDHRGGYLPYNLRSSENMETKICRVAIFSRQTIDNRKCTQFDLGGVAKVVPLRYGDVLIFPPEQVHRATPANLLAKVAFGISVRIKNPIISKLFLHVESLARIFENRRAIFITTGSIEGEITDFYEQKNLDREDEQVRKFDKSFGSS